MVWNCLGGTILTITHYVGGKLVGLTSDFPPSTNYPENTVFIDTQVFQEFILVGGVWELVGQTVSAWDYEENFQDYATQAQADAAWVTNDNAGARVDINNDRLDIHFPRNNVGTIVYHDLGFTLSNTQWLMRYTWHHVTSAPTDWGYYGMSNNTVNRNTNQDFLGLAQQDGGGYNAQDSDNGTLPNTGSPVQAYTWIDDMDYFVEVIRTSATTYTIEIFTSSDYSTGSLGLLNGVVASGTQGLQFIKFMDTVLGGSSENWDGYINRIQIQNNSVVPP